MRWAALLAIVVALCVTAPAERAAAQTAPGAPTATSLTAGGGSLTVSWTAPTHTGGSAVTSYDVRYILSSAGDKSDGRWTVVSDISPPGTLQHVLTLYDSTSYDVQVRAVNAVRPGGWGGITSGTSLDHGAGRTGATAVTLDSTVPGRMTQEGDVDLFKLVLTEAVDLWFYSTGGVDTEGSLQDSSGRTITSNSYSEPQVELDFAIRRSVNAGTYYLRVASSTRNSRPTGWYSLHIRAVHDPGSTAATATPVSLDGTYGGRVDSTSADDYFQLTVARDSWVKLRAIAIQDVLLALTPTIRDSGDQEVDTYVLSQSYWSEIHNNHVAFEATAFLAPGTYVVRVAEAAAGSGGRYTLKVRYSGVNQDLLDRCTKLPSLLGEPLSGCQWHLKNTGNLQAGGARQDINVEAAWEVTKGAGVTVAVIDGGFQVDHPDLRDNTLTALNHTPAGTFFSTRVSHGTNVAGLIAARDNGFGMVGVAPRASIYGSNVLRVFTTDNISTRAAQAAVQHLEQTAVSNNSWGPGDVGTPKLSGADWEAAIERGLAEGFYGRGTVYVFGGGNGGDDDYSNLSEFVSHHGVITVCAVNYRDVRSPRSEKGPNLWVCAPSNQLRSTLPAIATTTNGGYIDSFGGTSAAAPLVSGVVALMRAANGELTWRDVKLILAATARKNDTSNSGWEAGALRYGSTGTRYNYNHSYGFGVVDASAAVALAQTWPGLPAHRTLTVTSAPLNETLDNNTVTQTLAIEGDYIEFIEYVTVNLDVDHDKFAELTIDLTAPSGVESKLLVGRQGDLWQLLLPQELRSPIDLGSARHLGEDPEGTWTLTVRDPSLPDDGTLTAWSLTIYGHGLKPRHPAIASVGPGNTYLTIGWTAPEDIGATAITSYDLRYIRSDATDRADEYWTATTRIWSAGDLVYELAGLTLDVGYDVQVRAVNSDGAGPWSEVAQGQTMVAEPGAPAIDSVVAGDGDFTVSWSAPARNGGAEITRYDVGYIEEDATDRTDSNWDVETAWNTGDGALEHTVSSIDNDLGYDIEVRAANSEGAGAWSATATLRRNQRPRFPSTETGLRWVDENTSPNRAVGAPVAATDEEGDTLTYSIAESGAAFSVDAGTGQLRTKDALDHEAAESRTVTVQVSDGKNARGDISTVVDATIVVTVTVDDVNEQPRADTDQVSTLEDERVMIDVLSNDSDPDEGDTMTVHIVTPPSGTATVESDQRVAYTPRRDYVGGDSLMYEVRDSKGLTAKAAVDVDIGAVNDAPTFPSATTTRTVAPGASAGTRVGARVAATDVDGDMLTYQVFGPPEFAIAEHTGQITVAPNAVLDPAFQESYAVIVDANDGNGGTATIDVTIRVTSAAPTPPGGGGGPSFGGGGGGGGGGGSSGPTPSDEDFEWTVTRDVEELDPGHDTPSGLWSDAATLWILENGSGTDDAVYAYDLGTGERVEEREFALHETNRAPRGVWSDEVTAWVSDSGQERLFAYHLMTGERQEERELALAARNSAARGIWSDGEAMWVLDGGKAALFAYDLATHALLGEYALDGANDVPHGVWSDRTTVWVSDDRLKRLIAYRLPARPAAPAAEDAEPTPLERISGEDFTLLSRASNNSPRGLWSDGEVMYVADESDDKVYTYNMPGAIDARLASLTLSGVEIGDFDPGRVEYEGTVAEGVTQATVEAGAAQPRAIVAVDPPDADPEAAGHQVSVEGGPEITVTVTSGDGSRTTVYLVRVGETDEGWAHCLSGAVASGFSLVFFEGGSIEELEECAKSRHVGRLYALEDGAWVPYIIGAPGFVNRAFGELFADGVPSVTALIAGSSGPASGDPAPEAPLAQGSTGCLSGEVASGFSIVVYSGGGVEELDDCARSLGVATLYALEDGAWVPYIIGAPEFVNRSFVTLHAGGLSPMTPLVARSDGPPAAGPGRDDAAGG